MLFTKSSILLLVAAAVGVSAHPAPEAEPEPATSTLDKRWAEVHASLYSTTCGTDDFKWELNDDSGRCITFDEGKDVYSISRSAFNGWNNGYPEPNCMGQGILLQAVDGQDGCFAQQDGKPFKSFLIVNTDPKPSTEAVVPAV
ncbi:hypothetical protein BJX70DRAFT_355173 [Aspergillus crustosus]